MQKRGLELHAVAEITQQVGDGEAAGLFEEAARGERARRVRELRLGAAEAAESRLERPERHGRAALGHAVLRPVQAVAFERGCDALVEPRRHTPLGQRPDEGMSELVRQHAIQLLWIVERAAHRHADRAVVGARGPGRRACDVCELLGRVQDDVNRVVGIAAEHLADPPVRPVQRLERLRCDFLFTRPFERHREMRSDRLLHAIV